LGLICPYFHSLQCCACQSGAAVEVKGQEERVSLGVVLNAEQFSKRQPDSQSMTPAAQDLEIASIIQLKNTPSVAFFFSPQKAIK